jgi:hypothetical protein
MEYVGPQDDGHGHGHDAHGHGHDGKHLHLETDLLTIRPRTPRA